MICDTRDIGAEGSGGQSCATRERVVCVKGDAIGDNYADQARTIGKRTPSDANDAVRYCDTCQLAAVVKRVIPNRINTAGNSVTPDFALRTLDEYVSAFIE